MCQRVKSTVTMYENFYHEVKRNNAMSEDFSPAERFVQWANKKFGSLRQLAEELGKSSNYISYYTRRDELPNPLILRTLEDRYGLDLHWIYHGEGTEKGIAREQGILYNLQSGLAEFKSVRGYYEAMSAYGELPEWVQLSDAQRQDLEYWWNICRANIDQIQADCNARIVKEERSFDKRALAILAGENIPKTQPF